MVFTIQKYDVNVQYNIITVRNKGVNLYALQMYYLVYHEKSSHEPCVRLIFSRR